MNMAMYNEMFLVYVALTGTSFFAFALTLLSIEIDKLPLIFNKTIPVKFIGGFLIFTASSIAMLWLGVVVPPLVDKTIILGCVQAYATNVFNNWDN